MIKAIRKVDHNLKEITKFLFIVLLLVIIPLIILARPFRLNILPDKGKSFGCLTCHVNPNGGARNPFGVDYERFGMPAGDKYTDALSQIDSDKDGFTNDEEFSANPVTNPGDPKSRPPERPKAVNPKQKMITSWSKVKINNK